MASHVGPGDIGASDPSRRGRRRWEIQDLGPAVTSVNVRAAGFGHLPDGTQIVYALSGGAPAAFSVAELITGKRLFSKEILGSSVASWALQAPDGDIYFSVRQPTPAALYRFDTATMRLHHIEDRVAGASSLHRGIADQQGRIWFGTHPSPALVCYDPRTESFRQTPPLVDDASCVFAVGTVDDQIWVGTGPVAHLFSVDPETLASKELHPPPHVMDGTEWFVSIDQRNADVLVRLSPRGAYDTAIFHTRDQTWDEQIIPGTHGDAPTPVAADGTTYLLGEDDRLIGYHTHGRGTRTAPMARPTPPTIVPNAVNTYGLGLVRVPELGLPGQSVAGITTDGDLWFADIGTGQSRVVPADIHPTAATVQAVGTAPDGHVHVGAFMSSGAYVRIDQHTTERHPLRGPRQSDVITSHGSPDPRLVITSCPGPRIHFGDHRRPWEWERNPRAVLDEHPDIHYQERIVAVTSAAALVVFGTVAAHGRNDGGLGVLDPRSGACVLHRDVAAGQSVVSLVHRDGIIHATTSIHGGVGSRPVTAHAQLFAWDLAEQTVRWRIPIEADHAGGLLWTDHGLIGSTSAGELFVVDAERGRITRTVRLVPEPVPAAIHPHAARTIDRGRDGFVVSQANCVVQVDPGLTTSTLIARGIEQIAEAGNGRIFGFDETNVHTLTITDDM